MPRSISDLLGALLTGVVSGFNDAQVELPVLRYQAAGLAVAYDTDQVTTNLLRIYPGRPASEQAYQYPLEQVFTAEIQVAIVRAVAVVQDDGAPPALADLEANATTFGTDVDTLTTVLMDLVLTATIAPHGVPCVFLGVDAYGPSGGVVGTLGKLAVQLV